jgi:hypothetical protein
MSDGKRTEYVASNQNPPARVAVTEPAPTLQTRLSQRLFTAQDWIVAGIAGAGLVLLLSLAVTGRLTEPFGRGSLPNQEVISEVADDLVLGGDKADPYPGPAAGVSSTVAARFQSFYNSRDGERLFGKPLGAPVMEGGREVQWFERARLEYYPEYIGTPYEIQLGLLGLTFTEGRNFPVQQFFVSRPGLRYFPETGHGVGGLFLQYWERNGGLDMFGLPISEEFDEMLPDGQIHRVQYFQRVRMEYWPQYAGSPNEIQLGLLGKAIYDKDPRPTGVQPAPTAVPLP